MPGGVVGPGRHQTTPQSPAKVTLPKPTDNIVKAQHKIEAKQKPSEECVYEKKDVGEDQNEKVRYASKISNNNLDFISTLNHENGLWSVDRKSNSTGVGGYRAYGICQFYWTWHKDFIQSEEFKDYKVQINKCWDLWNVTPHRFNAYTNGSYKKHKNLFDLSCKAT